VAAAALPVLERRLTITLPTLAALAVRLLVTAEELAAPVEHLLGIVPVAALALLAMQEMAAMEYLETPAAPYMAPVVAEPVATAETQQQDQVAVWGY
jgi:hypothetical protein